MDGDPVAPTSWLSSSELRLSPPASGGEIVEIYRETSIEEAAVAFTDGNILSASSLNKGYQQVLFRQQELGDLSQRTVAQAITQLREDETWLEKADKTALAAATGALLVGAAGAGVVQDYIFTVSANAHGVSPVPAENLVNGYPTAPVDQAPALQAAVDYAATVGASVVHIKGNGVVPLGSTIIVPIGITIEGATCRAENTQEFGEGQRIVPMTSGTYYTETGSTVSGNVDCSAGYLFFMNVDPASPSTWARSFPNIGAGGIHNLAVDGTPTTGISVAYFAGSHTFDNLRLTRVATAVKKPSGVYTDGVQVKHLFARLRANATAYLVDLPGNGDAYEIYGIHSGYTGAQTGVTKAVNVGLCRSGHFALIVNGISTFTNCTGTVSECHVETGQLVIDGGHMTVASNKLYNGKNSLVPLVIRNSATSSTLSSGTVVIRENNFIHSLNAVGDVDGWSGVPQLDVRFEDSRMDATIGVGNRRTVTVSQELGRNHVMAPAIGDSNGEYPLWKAHAHWLCLRGTNINAGAVDVNGVMQPVDTTITVTAATYTTSSSDLEDLTFDAPTGTYHYAVEIIADPVRAIGRTCGTVSQAATLGSATLPVLRLGWGTLRRSGGFIVRIYRGTSAGVYDKVVDVPAIECKDLIDDGSSVNSFAWTSRAAGPATAINHNAQNGILDYRFGTVEGFNITFNSNPTTGNWKAGDRLHLSSTADHEARLCTADGGPGTWVKLGVKGLEKQTAITPSFAAPAGGTTVDAECRTAAQKNADDVAAIVAKLKAQGLWS